MNTVPPTSGKMENRGWRMEVSGSLGFPRTPDKVDERPDTDDLAAFYLPTDDLAGRSYRVDAFRDQATAR